MYLTKETKEKIFKKHGKDAKDTGSAEGQIALFTHRINHLTEHLKQNRKDFNTERSLVKLVGKRRSLLDYLMKKDILRYRAIVKELGLRKPDLDFYLKALEITKAKPKETIFLDDLGINLKPAKELGMTTIKVLNSKQALKELSELIGICFE